MIVNNEYYLLLAAMLLLVIIDEKKNHTAITMTGSMKHSILYAPAQQNFNGANVDDTTKIPGITVDQVAMTSFVHDGNQIPWYTNC